MHLQLSATQAQRRGAGPTSHTLQPELDAKYAKLWNETSSWQIPQGLEPFRIDGDLTPREQNLYTEAMWKILDLLASDGLITRAALRAAHEEEKNWKPGTSKIHVGYVPPNQVTDQEAAA